VETLADLDKGGLVPETPKSRAGRRTVAFPAELVPELRWHLERFAEPGERGYVFVGPKGARLRRSSGTYVARTARQTPLSTGQQNGETAADLRSKAKSGRRESNPHDQLGRCMAHSRQGH